MSETPMENFVVVSALLDALGEPIVIDLQKPDAKFIETFAEVRLVIVMQFFTGVCPYFVEHSTEIHEAADSTGRATNS